LKTFEEHLNVVISQAKNIGRPLVKGECQSPTASRCTLCHAVDLAYDAEVSLKKEALHLFWKQYFPPELLSTIVASPLGREYRTVTKRRAFRVRETVTLGLIAPTDEGSYKPFEVVRCAIEPEGHAPIYRKVQEILGKPYATPLADALSYVIIKGSYTEYTLIFNVRERTPDVVRAVNTLSKSLTHSFKEIVGVFLYHDETSSRYYLGRTKKDGHPAAHKIYGNAGIYQRICGKSFLYSPLAFSQVNQSIVEEFVRCAGNLLDLTKETTLYDLYCGYGMFALCLAEKAGSVVGVEISAESVASAIANSRRQKVANVRFVRGDITPESLHRAMKSSRGNDAILLDPPRSGTDKEVIEYIAARKPTRVLHIFCNIDIMPNELKRWTESGYSITRAIPFDMFPGTSAIEMMVLLTPR
jgi:tRNA/tmRNA/rRNA uracil-C5-methylase (TrmA/RlmC/RlmD family)